jgi:NAD(P)-dependent dehydrogenase (short-subunit alcohol dehydrogenase family)
MPMNDHVVIISGASAGLGRTMALCLLEGGRRLVAMGRDERSLTTFAAEVSARGFAQQLLTVRGDVTKPEDCRKVVDAALNRFDRIDVLINNAAAHLPATRTPAKFYELTDLQWNAAFDTNVTGAFYMARAVTPHLIERGWGRIINHQTTYGTMLRAGMNPYGPSKAALEAATVAWAEELAGTGVTVNEILPGGAADVPRISSEVFPDRSKLVSPDVLIAPILWLTSDASNGISGHRITANRWDHAASAEQNLRTAVELAGWRGATTPATEPR